jgi:hypothetical protein
MMHFLLLSLKKLERRFMDKIYKSICKIMLVMKLSKLGIIYEFQKSTETLTFYFMPTEAISVEI